MRILIIEDEELAAERLEKQLLEINPDYEVVAKIGSVKESVKWFMSNSADLIFLDIQLSDGISFSIFEQISVITPIIFTTAYDQYSIKAFQLNSIAYLLKPIKKAELTESLRKFNTLKSAFNIDFEHLLAEINGQTPQYKKRFLIQLGDKIQKVETSQAAFFYALEKSVFLKTFDNSSFPLDFSLDKLEQLLNPDEFFRINRKYIVNIESISKMHAWSRGRIKLTLSPEADDEADTIVSIIRSGDFKKWLSK
ncbi:MAG: LytTR family DNA-binding domain-containing protein [Bacteroidales bacterium]|nr:LytTR family DNA-binding domain-containing protein [Bacteroidales bacterium]